MGPALIMRKLASIVGVLLSLPVLAITISWDPAPTNNLVTGYFVYSADAITGPWTCIGSATNGPAPSFYVALQPCQKFFYLTASNWWGESLPSNVFSTPPVAGLVTNTAIKRTP